MHYHSGLSQHRFPARSDAEHCKLDQQGGEREMNARHVLCALLSIAPHFCFADVEDDQLRELAKRTFWEDRSVSPDGYFILSKAYAHTRVIEGLRKALDSRPTNSRFDCRSSLLVVEKGVSESGVVQDTFFFRTGPDRRVMLSIFDRSSERSYRSEEAYNAKVNGQRATIALVVDRANPKNTRWGVGWDPAAGSVSLSVENDGKAAIGKDWVMRMAESVQCVKLAK